MEALRRAFKTVLENNAKAKRAAGKSDGSQRSSSAAAAPPSALSASAAPATSGSEEDSAVGTSDKDTEKEGPTRATKRATLQTNLSLE